jgi:hypothetical protein
MHAKELFEPGVAPACERPVAGQVPQGDSLAEIPIAGLKDERAVERDRQHSQPPSA